MCLTVSRAHWAAPSLLTRGSCRLDEHHLRGAVSLSLRPVQVTSPATRSHPVTAVTLGASQCSPSPPGSHTDTDTVTPPPHTAAASGRHWQPNSSLVRSSPPPLPPVGRSGKLGRVGGTWRPAASISRDRGTAPAAGQLSPAAVRWGRPSAPSLGTRPPPDNREVAAGTAQPTYPQISERLPAIVVLWTSLPTHKRSYWNKAE